MQFFLKGGGGNGDGFQPSFDKQNVPVTTAIDPVQPKRDEYVIVIAGTTMSVLGGNLYFPRLGVQISQTTASTLRQLL